MEVILKKCKITKSIFNQTIGVNIRILNKYISLGWVFVDNIKWILLYNSEKNDLKKIIFFYDPKVSFDQDENKYNLELLIYNENKPIFYECTESEAHRIVSELIKIKQESIEKGQFFI